MRKSLTRRQFMKGTAGTVAGLGVMGLPLQGGAEACCGKCGAATRRNLVSTLLPLVVEPLPYCPNCGISLRTFSHEIDCPDYEQCVYSGQAFCLVPGTKGSPCFEIPFPNRKLLVGLNRTKDGIAALKF